MQFRISTAPGRRPQASRLHLTLSAQLDAAAVDRCLERVQAFVQPFGLCTDRRGETFMVLDAGDFRGVTPFSRGVVIGWLMAQPEVVMVAVERSRDGAPSPLTSLPVEVCND